MWTINNCLNAKGVNSVWVSTDSDDISDIACHAGANLIKRPAELADDNSTGESGWLHAINVIEEKSTQIDVVLAPQVTSPLRETKDIERGIEKFQTEDWDSMFSCSVVGDLYFWESAANGRMRSVNYDYRNRQRRQEFAKQYVENGSYYLFRPDVIRRYQNRLGGKIGCIEMEFWKMFEIDDIDDLRICSAIMKEFILGRKS